MQSSKLSDNTGAKSPIKTNLDILFLPNLFNITCKDIQTQKGTAKTRLHNLHLQLSISVTSNSIKVNISNSGSLHT
jgi:hypothetical protein